MMMAVGKIAGGVVGGLIGGTIANAFANELFGKRLDLEEIKKEGIKGEIPGWLIDIFRWLKPQF